MPVGCPESTSIKSPPRVLVLDGQSDTDAVLRAVLEPRGLVVEWTRAHLAAHNWPLADQPAVVVVDLDETPEMTEQPVWSSTPHVLLGSARVAADGDQSRFLEKPFQVVELIRAVEDLLEVHRAA